MTTETTNNSTVTEYAVFGAGWGSEYLSTVGNHPGSGRIAYRGSSKEKALKVLAKMHREVARLREQPGMRNVSDTYRLYDDGGKYGWRVSHEE